MQATSSTFRLGTAFEGKSSKTCESLSILTWGVETRHYDELKAEVSGGALADTHKVLRFDLYNCKNKQHQQKESKIWANTPIQSYAWSIMGWYNSMLVMIISIINSEMQMPEFQFAEVLWKKITTSIPEVIIWKLTSVYTGQSAKSHTWKCVMCTRDHSRFSSFTSGSPKLGLHLCAHSGFSKQGA